MKNEKTPMWRRLLDGTEAVAIVEAALVLPIVFMLLLGIIEIGRAYNIYTTMTYAAQEGVKVAVQRTCATCNNTPAAASDVAARISQVLQASKIDPGAIQTYTGTSALTSCAGGTASSTSSGNVTLYTNVEINATTRRRRGRTTTTVTGPTGCGAVVTFQYPFQFTLPFTSLNTQIVALKADVQLENEN